MKNIIKNLADLYKESPVKVLAELCFAYDLVQYKQVKAREKKEDTKDLLKEQERIIDALDFVKGTFDDKDVDNAVRNAVRLSHERMTEYKINDTLSSFSYPIK